MLFLCSGNYYRSRFAEGLFNHTAASLRLNWRAISRGLNVERNPKPDEISPFTLAALRQREIDIGHVAPRRQPLLPHDLEVADLVVAMYRDEHEPMITDAFPALRQRVIFWDVPDWPRWLPERAFARIEGCIQALVDRLSQGACP